MKLTRNERGTEQLHADATIGIGRKDNEFSFNRDFTEIEIPCGGKRFSGCLLRITTGEAAHPIWHWNGNLTEPTLTPSIGCENRCGWHGNLTKGELTA